MTIIESSLKYLVDQVLKIDKKYSTSDVFDKKIHKDKNDSLVTNFKLFGIKEQKPSTVDIGNPNLIRIPHTITVQAYINLEPITQIMRLNNNLGHILLYTEELDQNINIIGFQHNNKVYSQSKLVYNGNIVGYDKDDHIFEDINSESFKIPHIIYKKKFPYITQDQRMIMGTTMYYGGVYTDHLIDICQTCITVISDTSLSIYPCQYIPFQTILYPENTSLGHHTKLSEDIILGNITISASYSGQSIKYISTHFRILTANTISISFKKLD